MQRKKDPAFSGPKLTWNGLRQSGKLSCGLCNQNLNFSLEIMEIVSSGFKRRESISIEFSKNASVHICEGPINTDRWYTGFRATNAAAEIFFFLNWVFGKGSDMIAKFINFIHHSEERTGRGSLMCNIWISLNIGAAAWTLLGKRSCHFFKDSSGIILQDSWSKSKALHWMLAAFCSALYQVDRKLLQ